MKIKLALIIVAAMITFISCGPSAKEKAEKAIQDSISKVDSLKNIILGAWKNDNTLILISNENNSYKIRITKLGQELKGTIQNGTISVNLRDDIHPVFEDFTISEDGDLLWSSEVGSSKLKKVKFE